MSAKLGQAWQEKNVWKEKAKEAGVDVAAVEAEMRKGINEVLSDENDPRKDKAAKEGQTGIEDNHAAAQSKKGQLSGETSVSEEEEEEE